MRKTFTIKSIFYDIERSELLWLHSALKDEHMCHKVPLLPINDRGSREYPSVLFRKACAILYFLRNPIRIVTFSGGSIYKASLFINVVRPYREKRGFGELIDDGSHSFNEYINKYAVATVERAVGLHDFVH